MTWAAVAGAAISVAGGIYSQRRAERATRGQRRLEGEMAENIRQTRPMGMNMLRSAIFNMDEFDDFWRKVGKGSRADAMRMLAPQFAAMDRQAQAARSADLLGGGRGGGSAERQLDSRDALLGQRNDMLLGLRTDAVGKLGASADARANLGTNLLSGANSGALGLMGAMSNRVNSESMAAARGANASAQIGAGVERGINNWRDRPKTAPLPASRQPGNINQWDLTPGEERLPHNTKPYSTWNLGPRR